MKLGPVTKFDKKSTKTLEKLAMTSCRQIMTSLLFSWFMADFEQSASRIPDAWSVISTFLLITAFFLIKAENRTKKNLQHSSLTIALSEGTIFAKKMPALGKKVLL